MANIDTTNIDEGSVVVEAKATDFEDNLLTFAGTDAFVAGTILARSGQKLVLYVKTGGGANTPVAVLTYPVSRVGAGDVAIRALVGGTVNFDRLVIDNAQTVDKTVADALRNFGIVAVRVTQLANIDNPQA